MPDVTPHGPLLMRLYEFAECVRAAQDVSLMAILTQRTPSQIAENAAGWGITAGQYRTTVAVEAMWRGLIPKQEGPCPT